MATFKAVVQKQKSDGSYPVYIRCTHNRKIAYINTGMIALSSDIEKKEIKNKGINLNCSVLIKGYLDKINNIDHADWSVEEVVSFISKKSHGVEFYPYAQQFIYNLSKQERNNSANNYKIALSSFKKFMGDNIHFQDITSKKIGEWIESLSCTARAKQMYPTAIKTIFNAGCLHFNDYDRGIFKIKNDPFRVTKIPKSETPIKKAIDPVLIRKIFYHSPQTERGKLAQDVIKLVFYLVGINTVDLYNLKHDNLKGWLLCYNRSKTKKGRSDKAYIEIKVPEKVRYIFEKHKGSNSLFNFSERYANSTEFNRNVNRGLKAYCAEIGIEKVDTYTFRHSWATIAQNQCGASDEDVAFALNHAPAHKVTRGYIKTDFTKIDRLNEQVLKTTFFRKTTKTKLKAVRKVKYS